MDKKKSIEVVRQLTKYFNAKVIGSQMFVDAGLLSEEDTNDIDIVVLDDKYTELLKDHGFVKQEDGIRYLNPEYDKPIDVFTSYVNQPRTIDELIVFKFDRGYQDDLNQLIKVVENKKNK